MYTHVFQEVMWQFESTTSGAEEAPENSSIVFDPEVTNGGMDEWNVETVIAAGADTWLEAMTMGERRVPHFGEIGPR